MPLSEEDVSVGVIAYFTIDDLRADASLSRTGGSPDPKARPFVCYAQDSVGRFYWTPLTTDDGQPGRASLARAWIIGASGKLASDLQMVNDGGHTYAGPRESFAHLSQAHDKAARANHPRLAADGIVAVLREVESRNGLRPSSGSPDGS